MFPLSAACERNKVAIAEQLKIFLKDKHSVLEIGSGTGQHAVFFCQQMPQLQWQSTEVQANISHLSQYLASSNNSRLLPPITLNVNDKRWPKLNSDAIFSANTAHIMSWQEVQTMIRHIGDTLPQQGLFCLYGPFQYAGKHTSDSNLAFDDYLKQQDPKQGIRDALDIIDEAQKSQMLMHQDLAMPSNNRLLIFVKT